MDTKKEEKKPKSPYAIRREKELLKAIHFMNHRVGPTILVRPSKPGDFRSGWSPVFFEKLSRWTRFKRGLRRFIYDHTHKGSVMCTKCNGIVHNIGCSWMYPFGIQLTSYYYPDRCPHCGD